MHAVIVSLWTQGFLCTMALLLNLTLAIVVYKSSRQDMGFYKWMLIAYCLFEILYAIAVLQAMPVHVVFDHTWMFFSFRGPLIGTSAAFLNSAIYCFFYEVWMGLVVINFVYRYTCVCRHDWLDYIQSRDWIRWFFLSLFTFFIGICVVCTVYLCTLNKISAPMEHKIQEDFLLTDPKQIGYTMLRLFDLQGRISFSGISATFIHAFIVFVSVAIIAFCSFKIWRRITYLQRIKEKANVRMEKQLFRTLLIQFIIPVVLCHIPSAAHLTFAFWEEFPLDCLTPFFSVFTTVPKALDPIIAFICIAEYRNTLRRILGCKPQKVYSSQLSQAPSNTFPHTTTRDHHAHNPLPHHNHAAHSTPMILKI